MGEVGLEFITIEFVISESTEQWSMQGVDDAEVRGHMRRAAP